MATVRVRKLKVEIIAENGAFAFPNAGSELARILRALADLLDGQNMVADLDRPLSDNNGNLCGRAVYKTFRVKE